MTEPARDPSQTLSWRQSTVVLFARKRDRRQRTSSALTAAGYQVLEVRSTPEALCVLGIFHVEALVADAAPTGDDCRALLGLVREDCRTADVRVVVGGGTTAWLEDLRAGGVAPDACVTDADAQREPQLLVEAVDTLLARRFGVLAELRDGVWGALGDVGLVPLLTHVCRARLRGRLTVSDATTTWQVSFDDGAVVSAVAVRADASAGPGQSGLAALTSLFEAREAPFVFEPLREPPAGSALARHWRTLFRAVADEVNASRARVRMTARAMGAQGALGAAP